jgi:hypothetical protein
MTRYIKFKENKKKINEINLEIIDCMDNILNTIDENMYIYYKELNITSLIEIDKRLQTHYEKIKNCIYITKNNVLNTPLNSLIIYISMHNNSIKSGKLLKILNNNKYLVEQGNRHINVFLDSYYVFYERFIKSKFRNTLEKILDGKIKIKKKK